jgi:hypothetical protein
VFEDTEVLPSIMERRHRGITPTGVERSVTHCGCCKSVVVVDGFDVRFRCACPKQEERCIKCGKCLEHCCDRGKRGLSAD